MAKIREVVTFNCSPQYVHVYYEGCSTMPMSPYKSHLTPKAAAKHLKEKFGTKEVIVIKKK